MVFDCDIVAPLHFHVESLAVQPRGRDIGLVVFMFQITGPPALLERFRSLHG